MKFNNFKLNLKYYFRNNNFFDNYYDMQNYIHQIIKDDSFDEFEDYWF